MALLAVLRPEHAARVGINEDGGLRLYVRLRCSSLAHPCHRRQHDGEREQEDEAYLMNMRQDSQRITLPFHD